jgi:Surface lipoprotein
MQHTFSGILIGVVITLGGCATTGNTTQQTVASKVDPYENFNRKMFGFNDTVDNYVAEPISNAYKWITPQFMQTGVFNFFNNLKNVNVVINDVLQAKFSQSAEDTGRFAINSTVGLGGLFDVAKHVGLEQNEEDFEQTLAVWGVPQGSYLVLPILGPSTARGIPGAIFDTAANPASYIGLPVQLVSMLNARASAEGSLKFIDEAALDPYVFTRESFLQWRNNLATDGKAEASLDVDDFEGEALDGGKGAASKQASSGNLLYT